MQYKIVSANEPGKLEVLVSAYLKDGWTLQGGVSIARDQGNFSYVQALVK